MTLVLQSVGHLAGRDILDSAPDTTMLLRFA
jgi:hypothetical protein